MPVPEKFASLIVTAPQVNSRLAHGEDPVVVSIDKWQTLISSLEKMLNEYSSLDMRFFLSIVYDHIGYTTCALCLDSIERYEALHGEMHYSSDKCQMCSLAKIERCVDQSSLYRKIEAAFRDLAYEEYEREVEVDKTRAVKALCEEMLSRLQRLS